jgi:hypothetical protein
MGDDLERVGPGRGHAKTREEAWTPCGTGERQDAELPVPISRNDGLEGGLYYTYSSN